MSTQPIWITPPGNLGTVPEGAYYQVPLQVSEPDGSTVYFKVIAGALPSGVECTTNGIIQGVPTNIATVSEEAAVTGVNVTSKFAIRAYTTTTINGVTVVNRLADRTFTLTIAGQPNAEWITPSGTLGQFFEGELLLPGLQLEYTIDSLSGSTPVVTLVSGILPTGLSISSTGLISGFIGLNPKNGLNGGFDETNYDIYGFSFDSGSPSYNFSFTLKLTDGQTTSLRNFSMYVWDPANFNASTTLITADDTYLLASASNSQLPSLLNPEGSIGISPSNTFFAYQFTGEDANNDTIGYQPSSLLPPGLTLDPVSGWLYGYLPNIGLTEITYNLSVTPYQYNNPAVNGRAYNYTLTVTGSISANVTWLTPSNLGSINNGDTSLFYIAAETTSNLSLNYRLLSGSNSVLPQGLTLLPSGNIVGRVSFNTFALDEGNTTIDGNATTFDMTYTFTVNAYSSNGYISVNNTFTITVIREYNAPYKNLYIKCMSPQSNRTLIDNLLDNTSIFEQKLLYRPDDPNFGVSSDVTYSHAYGLNAANIDTYIQSLDLNHYWKNLTLGEIKTAQAVDPITGNVIYDVVYSEIIDDLVNNQGESVGKSVILPYPLNDGQINQINDVYPNALVDMRNQVIDVVGQESNILPLWMLSQQADGSVLGFTPAWVIAYTQPGQSGRVAYNIETQFGDQLNLISFEADRYELDNSLTVNWSSDIVTLTITGLSGNGATVTVNYTPQHTPPVFIVGDQVVIQNVIPSSYNGTYYITASTTSSVSFSSTNTAAYVSGGIASTTPGWVGQDSTTFDINYHYDTYIQSGGVGYSVGDQVKILGTIVGGVSPANDIYITVTAVNSHGGIVEFIATGTADIAAYGSTYLGLVGVTVTGSGLGSVWSSVIVPGKGSLLEITTISWINNSNYGVLWYNNNNVTVAWTNGTTVEIVFDTRFDGGSTTFNAPADLDTNTDTYDQYLMFPNINIIDLAPNLSQLTWVNNAGVPFTWFGSGSITWINE